MLSWTDVDGVARAVWVHYGAYRADLDRLIDGAQKCPILPALPKRPVPVLPLGVLFEENANIYDLRVGTHQCPGATWEWMDRFGPDPQQRGIPPVLFEYWALVTVQNAHEGQPVAFHFTNRSLWDTWGWRWGDKSLAQRQEERQRLRELKKTLKGIHATCEGDLSKLDGEAFEAWQQAKKAAGRIFVSWRLHHLKTSPREKAKMWELQLRGKLEAPYPHLGPIVLSSRTSPEEIRLKMALLGARLGALDDASLKPILGAIRDVLGNRLVEPREVLNVTLYGAGGERRVGYVGDFSDRSFKAYLRRVARRVFRDSYEARPWTRHASASATHPWTEGRPALLARLAVESEVPPHQARQWVRDGKLRAEEVSSGSPLSQDVTTTGDPVRGRFVLPAAERERWEALCAAYHDMRMRKDKTAGLSPTEKKRWYRDSRRLSRRACG